MSASANRTSDFRRQKTVEMGCKIAVISLRLRLKSHHLKTIAAAPSLGCGLFRLSLNGDTRASIFNAHASIALDNTLVKIVA